MSDVNSQPVIRNDHRDRSGKITRTFPTKNKGKPKGWSHQNWLGALKGQPIYVMFTSAQTSRRYKLIDADQFTLLVLDDKGHELILYKSDIRAIEKAS